ncbi:MAG: pyridoxal phosphate-dependent aminotransferase [Butyrivibrio sp.]|jgi:cystathionine beta-lyase|nr:pyridoxal phosphate-dependent aminotransferase [Butyrivibrio sp.]
MNFDFDKMTDRTNTASLKWEIRENELPMWVADMDFETAPAVTQAVLDRAAHQIFGYNIVPPQWNEAYCSWWRERHHFEMQSEWLVFCTGVVPAISSIVRKMTTIGENVLVQTPCYNIFFNSIVNNGRHILESPLVYAEGEYHIDYEDLERKLSDTQTSMMILCNPHNPIGKIWDRHTLEEIGELCWRHHVLILSDEIHCDLTDPGEDYIPFASVSEHCAQNSITCMAPTKAFNMAGLQTAAIMAPNEFIRKRAERGLNTDEVAEPNSFAVPVTVAAFTEGGEWLDALRNYIYENKMLVRSYVTKELPQIHLVPSQATYLLWLDCRNICRDSDVLAKTIRNETGLWLASGREYGESGEGFLRMNIAAQRSRVEDGLRRLKKGLESSALRNPQT